MVNREVPCTYENWENPWLMNKDADCLELGGNKISSEYLWSLNIEERNKCLEDVFSYYRKVGFPYERYDKDYLIKEFNKLCKYDINKVVLPEGYISNYGNLCLDICRHFCWDKFWKASNDSMLSIEDVFNNDELFKNVLKNRMGWNTTNEGGVERPYMFSIFDGMIRVGIRNSGLGYGVSNFRPAIAKFIYSKYLGSIEHPVIFDYSGGWGARALAAASLGYDYYCVDPLTSDNIEEIGKFVNNECKVKSVIKSYKVGSEIEEVYSNIPKVDMCMSCPPYFNLEVYSEDESQSYNEYKRFEDWIELYWKKTVENCDSILKDGGYFVLVIKDFYNNLPLKDSMVRIIEDIGYKLLDTYQYKTSQSHLSGKVKTGKVSKNSEYILVYELAQR